MEETKSFLQLGKMNVIICFHKKKSSSSVLPAEMTFVPPAADEGGGAVGEEERGGYVKGLVMVTDGLEVTSMSAISSITLINKFSVGTDIELAEKYVSVGMDEGLGLLRAVMRSDTVLADVFLGRKK
jgi:hypothetical protein